MSAITIASFTDVDAILEAVTQEITKPTAPPSSPASSEYSSIECPDSPTSSHPSMPDLTTNEPGEMPSYLAAGIWPDQQEEGFTYLENWDPVSCPEAWAAWEKPTPHPGAPISIPFKWFTPVIENHDLADQILRQITDMNEQQAMLFCCMMQLQETHQDLWSQWRTMDGKRKSVVKYHQSRMITSAQRLEDTAQDLFLTLCSMGFINNVYDTLKKHNIIPTIHIPTADSFNPDNDDNSQRGIRTRPRKQPRCFKCKERGHKIQHCHKGKPNRCHFCDKTNPRHVPQACNKRPLLWHSYKNRHDAHFWDKA